MPESNLAAVSSYERYGSASETFLDKKKHAQDQDVVEQFVMDPVLVEKYHLLNEATSYSYSTMPPDSKTTFFEGEVEEMPTTNIYLPNAPSQPYSNELPLANRFDIDTTAGDYDMTTVDSSTNREVTDSTEYPTTLTAHFKRSTTTDRPVRVTYAKPQFKPKPTKNANNYVLVQTITNDRFNETKNDVSENNMESIESIILMLNDTNPGPPYEATEKSESDSTEMITTYQTNRYRPETRRTTARPTFVTTTLSNSDPYESKRPNIDAILAQSTTYSTYNDYTSSPIYHPSTNYISVSQSTSKRPRPSLQTAAPTVEIIKTTVGSSSSKVPSTTKQTTRRKTTTSKTTTKKKTPPTTTTQNRPISVKIGTTTPATRKPPSTSYVYSPTPTKRPVDTRKPTKQSTILTMADFTTTNRLPQDFIVQSRPVTEARPSYVQIANSGTSERPSPTVHITPKPAIVASSTYGVDTKISTPPGVNYKPGLQNLPPSGISVIYNQSPAILIPAPADFENEGYFGISTTVRPSFEHTVTQTSIYTIMPNSQKRPPIQAFTPTTPHDDTIETLTSNDFMNFPPVRNPNLNATGYIGVGAASDEEEDFIRDTTPTFIEDEVVHNKLDLLVSKIVASLQPNFNGLADMVYERRNVTIIRDDDKPVSTSTKKPATKKPTQQKKPSQKPSKPQADTAVTTKKPPQKATTKKPAVTSKKPATTKRPVTKVGRVCATL